MLETLKPIKTTPTGIYFRMADGRIGYANHQYARVSVTREGIRNGEYYKEDNEIGDRLYQINSREEINREYDYNGVKKTISGVARVKYNDISEAINALQNFNCKNCGEYAVELRKNKILKEKKKSHEDDLLRIEKIKESLFPGNHLQERHQNLLHFCNRNSYQSIIHDLTLAIDPLNNGFTIISEQNDTK